MKLIQLGSCHVSRKNHQSNIRVEHAQGLADLKHSPIAEIHIQKSKRRILLVRADDRLSLPSGDLDTIAFLLKPIEQYLCKLRVCTHD